MEEGEPHAEAVQWVVGVSLEGLHVLTCNTDPDSPPCTKWKSGRASHTQSVLEAARHHGVVSTEHAQGVIVGVLQQQAQTEAVVALVLGVDRQLKQQHRPERLCSSAHTHTPETLTWLKMFHS